VFRINGGDDQDPAATIAIEGTRNKTAVSNVTTGRWNIID
jgi:hypothetical protein